MVVVVALVINKLRSQVSGLEEEEEEEEEKEKTERVNTAAENRLSEIIDRRLKSDPKFSFGRTIDSEPSRAALSHIRHTQRLRYPASRVMQVAIIILILILILILIIIIVIDLD